MSTTLKAYIGFGTLLMLLIFVGDTIESEEIRGGTWLPALEQEADIRHRKGIPINRGKPISPWAADQREQTENWADFLEEIDNRGYDIHDPEAEDIWETFK